MKENYDKGGGIVNYWDVMVLLLLFSNPKRGDVNLHDVRPTCQLTCPMIRELTCPN